jgi:RsiW-degrading membrane proteinase PrsW (M82 family)
MNLLLLAIAPVIIIAVYVYFRDRYEKEPIALLLKALFFGCLIVLPVVFFEGLLIKYKPQLSKEGDAFYTAFLVAGLTEEFFKYLALFILVWANRNFNEKFDGIVYAVFISLGFAGIENIMYVFEHGATTGFVRAAVSVPGHALFGVVMGYYFGLARFLPSKRMYYLAWAFIAPVLLHGIFDFILLNGNLYSLAVFIPYIIYLYINGFKKMKELSVPTFYAAKSEED